MILMLILKLIKMSNTASSSDYYADTDFDGY